MISFGKIKAVLFFNLTKKGCYIFTQDWVVLEKIINFKVILNCWNAQ